MRKRMWGYLTLLGTIAGIIGVFLLPEYKIILMGFVFFVVIVEIYFLIIGRYVRGREAVISFGNTLLEDAKEEVIMFGSDISWANDYKDTIRTIVNKNKIVKVYYVNKKEKSDITELNTNLKILQDAGAQTIELKCDFGLRGTLIDPNIVHETALYLVTRSKKKKPTDSLLNKNKNGDVYLGRLYTTNEHTSVMNIFTKMYQNSHIVVKECVQEVHDE